MRTTVVPQAAALRGVLLLATFALLILTPHSALAGETATYRFEPHPSQIGGEHRTGFRLGLAPGQSAHDTVRLTNKTQQARRFRVYGSDVDLNGDTAAVAPYEQRDRGVGAWISTAEEEFVLPARSSMVIDFEVSRPSSASTGGDGAVVAEELPLEDASGGIEVVYRVALIVHVGDTDTTTGLTLEAVDLDMPLDMIPASGVATAELENTSTDDVAASVRFTVESLTGQEWTLEPVEVTLPPGAHEVVETPWHNVPRWGGILAVRADVTWQGGTISDSSSRLFYPPLWLLAIAIVAVGVRGLRELWDRRLELRRHHEQEGPAPDPDELRGRLIEAAMWLYAAGRDAPTELREATIAEARVIAFEAARASGAEDIRRAANSLETFATGLASDETAARQAASDFDRWFREHRDDPRVKELVNS